MVFNNRDITQIKKKGLSPEEVAEQIEVFERGNIVVNIGEAATPKNGIIVLDEEKKEELVRYYDERRNEISILKFVPASGAATRMFKSFYTFLEEFEPGEEDLEEYIERKNDPKLELFFSRMHELPFHDQVQKILQENHPDLEKFPRDKQQYLFVETMLEEDGFNLGNQPKGLVPFHKYDDHAASAFEEHLREAVDYASSGEVVQVHFTVAEEHLEKFQEKTSELVPVLETETGKSFEITFSFQDQKTDTLAVTMENEPFRDEQGALFFRPGGHGALIENLNDRMADLIFIKNIDNVVTPKNRNILAQHKKMLGGKLLELQEKTFSCLEQLEKELSQNDLEEIVEFVQEELHTARNIDFGSLSTEEKLSVLKKKLNRPMRVCGMVRNEGEPGGGPFWVTHSNGEISLQIVESAQIDHENYQQSKIAQEATHFNPVDIACSFKNYKGANFDLRNFVDPETSFISEKTKDGKALKALELPGLWNGAMANWISVFVEVPVETFNPVKTVADLLKPSHVIN